MDLSYFMCSFASPHDCAVTPTTVIETDKATKQPQRSTVPEIVESSCSEASHISDKSVDFSESTATSNTIAPSVSTRASHIAAGKPGATSPSSLLLRRKLSTGIATDPSKKHPVLEGRPVIVPRKSSGTPISLTNCTATPDFSTMAVAHSTLREAPKSDPTRLDHLKRDASLGNNISATASPPFSNGASSDPNDEDQPGGKPVLRRSYTTPSERDTVQRFRLEPSPLRLEAWAEPSAGDFQVRGKNYLRDKVKIPSQQSFFRLLTVDLINTARPLFGGMCSHPQERVQQALKRERETGVKELPDFIFCVNLVVPGQSIYHAAFYFGIDGAALHEIRQGLTPTGRLMGKFLFGDSDEFRDSTFKLIPRIIEGNIIVRKAVGSKPSILGRKIKQYYIRTDRYMEVIVDIASDPMAQRIVKLCLGYIKSIVVDMMFVLEGQGEATLPERIFGGVRLKNIDFKEKDGKRVVASPI